MNKEQDLGASNFDPTSAFKALGDPTRFRIFNFLRSCCCSVAVGEEGEVRPVNGPTVGEVCCSVTGAEQITSTVSRHLRELKLAGLITIERRGKHMICDVNRDALSTLAVYFGDSEADNQNNGSPNGCC